MQNELNKVRFSVKPLKSNDNKVVEINGVKIVGETDILNSVKHAATKLYSENVRNLIELYIENSDDEIFTEMSS